MTVDLSFPRVDAGRVVELISATHPAAKDNHQWTTKNGAPA
jgi:hypothetical protein